MLPQTAYFKHEENLQNQSALFRSHGDCHLLARDERTENLFAQFSNHVYLSPDMAHQLMAPWKPSKAQRVNNFISCVKILKQSDIEKYPRAVTCQQQCKDWEDILSTEDDVVLALSWQNE